MSAIQAANILKRKRADDKVVESKRPRIDDNMDIVDEIYAINADLHDGGVSIGMPKLIAFGDQCSGKSTVLGRIIGHPILPARNKGELNMNAVTKVPIHINIHKLTCIRLI
ncbi:Msp1 protein [Faustovirus]|nr:Msp1 protein [Faustovirus]